MYTLFIIVVNGSSRDVLPVLCVFARNNPL